MMILMGKMPESCNMRGVCSVQWVVEANGNVYPCDFYALDKWCLGNINKNSFEDMKIRCEELGFIEQSRKICENCAKCKWYKLCRNGCKRNREILSDGSIGKNYFCSAYYNFFEHSYSRLAEIFRELTLK